MLSETYYHIYNRGINKYPIFFEEDNYYYFLKKFEKYIPPVADVFSYCLMPNHFHFFLRTGTWEICRKGILSPIEKAFKDFFISYAKSINKKYHRTGALFQYKFKRKIVDQENYYTNLIYYIHNNPVKAGLCKKFSEWKFSSYNAIIDNDNTFLKRHEVINWFGSKESFIHFHESNLTSQKDHEAFSKKFYF